MSQAVIIKSSKNGIILILDSEMEFESLLEEILKKFQESEKFFSNASFAISFEGRELTEEQQCEIVDSIMEHTKVKILCIIDNNEIRDAIIEQKIKAQQQIAQTKQTKSVFYYGALKPGEQLELDEAVTILGDVPKGASVISKSSVIVLGSLQGTAFAGMDGNSKSFLAALKFEPEQYNIAGLYGEQLPVKEKTSLFPKRNKTTAAKIAFIADGLIHVQPLEEGMDNYI